MKRVYFALLSAMLLTGCSHLVVNSPSEQTLSDIDQNQLAQSLLAQKTKKLTLSVTGKTQFRCVALGAQTRWVYEGMQAQLTNRAGRIVATQTNNTLTFKDYQVNLQLVGLPDGPSSTENLARAVFTITPALSPSLANTMERTDALGGLPLTRCSPGENNRIQRIGFQAKYVFWQ